MYSFFIAGNQELANMIFQVKMGHSSENAIIIPTCIDNDKALIKEYDSNQEITIGWIGGVGNLDYLNIVMPAIEKLSQKQPLQFVVISGAAFVPTHPITFPLKNVPWTLATQTEELLKMDIGIMPLPNNSATQGKSGFKLLQYMSLGIIAVANNIGVNKEIILDKKNGFLVASANDWHTVLETVIAQRGMWKEIGQRAQIDINNRYTFEANASAYLRFLERVSKQKSN
jgi:glycosyltransferase involved in cell wall biosynthesis